MKLRYLLLFIPLLFSSCNGDKTLLIWSDRKEMAHIAELYNRSGGEHRAVFQYREELVSSYFNEDVKPDVIIGTDLQNDLIKKEMMDMSGFLAPDDGKAPLINGTLLQGIDLDGEPKLIPLSYSPETVVFKRNSKRVPGGSPVMDVEGMRDLAVRYNEEKKTGYSPFWDDDFLLALLDLRGSSFTAGEEITLSWDESALTESLSFLMEWNDMNGGTERLDRFNRKYMYENRIMILKEERILFTLMNLSDFMTLADVVSSDLDFLYLSSNSRIHPGNVVYGGIPGSSGSYEIASDFFNWLLDGRSQELIIRSAIADGIGSFGFLGGLSSQDDVNSLAIPRYYPRMTGKIPESSYLLPLREKPVDYQSIRYDLIAPWLQNVVKGEQLSLHEALEKWEKLRIPF